MKVAIIGAGITGLTAGYELAKAGHEINVFETNNYSGGLAYGFKNNGWYWPLEIFYHHIFTNDTAIINLAHEIGIGSKLLFSRPLTSTYINGNIYQLDSPVSLLRFPVISIQDRFRTGLMLGLLKINPCWQPLENMSASDFIKKTGGNSGWKAIWEPLLYGKFHDYADSVQAAWFWARIKKRTPALGYFRGGFQIFSNKLAEKITEYRGKIFLKTKINSLDDLKQYNKILITAPTPTAFKLLNSINNQQSSINNSYNIIPHLQAQTLILETKEPILNKVYWLNINDRSFPFLAAVAHTNFINKKYYGGHHVTYFGNYLPDGHPYLKMNKNQIFRLFEPFIKKLNPNYSKIYVVRDMLFTGMYAQPVHKLNYSKKAPKLETSIPGVYMANMDSIYPWDRGTNYAVELGQKAASKIRE